MIRKVVATGDGSTTIKIVDWDEQYHSMHGAIQEAEHVFIKTGLEHWYALNSDKHELHILEIGFGTGLNALLTIIHSVNKPIEVYYEGVEAYPVDKKEVDQLNYVNQLQKPEYKTLFAQMHSRKWGQSEAIAPRFHLKKTEQHFENLKGNLNFDLLYFDAFGAQVQPELWSVAIFREMFNSLKKGGVLVTYSAKGSVRRAMQEVGFIVERLPGPPGKREMLRATKNQ
ncbi:MAG: tRNA (5-methylaminomethyl-2-thiouridine)(34)-methyltransferase MnmD [Leeuwenhoekiella sp.]